MFDLAALEAAAALVHQAFPPTPQYAWPLLAARAGAEVWVKHENHTPTGAFKLRGGLVYMDRLRRERPGVPGVVSATRGNHGQSLAWAGARHGVPVAIVVPRGNSAEKNAAMRAQGARLAALDIVRWGASRVVTVSDGEVAAAIRACWKDTHSLAEGAGAAPLAALLQDAPRMRGKRVGLVLCGGNIDLELFRRWVLGAAAAATAR